MRIISSTPSELKIDTVTFAFYQYIIEETDVPLVNCFPRTKSREGESILSKDGIYELICSYLDNDIQKEFFHRYWYAEGDHQLNSSEWTDVSSIAISQKGQSYQSDGTLVSINGSSYYKVGVDYYSSSYSWALGISSVFFNTVGARPVSMTDMILMYFHGEWIIPMPRLEPSLSQLQEDYTGLKTMTSHTELIQLTDTGNE